MRRIQSVLLYDNCIPYSSPFLSQLFLFYLRSLCRKGQSVYLWYDRHAAIYFYVKHKKHITFSHSVQISPRNTICIIRYCNPHIPVGSATITTDHLQLLGYNYLDSNWCNLRFGFIYVKYPCTLGFCRRNTDFLLEDEGQTSDCKEHRQHGKTFSETVHGGPINYKPSLVKIMTWRQYIIQSDVGWGTSDEYMRLSASIV